MAGSGDDVVLSAVFFGTYHIIFGEVSFEDVDLVS